MCYLVRQHHAGASHGTEAPAPGSSGSRLRWVPVAATAGIAAIALAASFLVTPPPPAQATAREAAPPVAAAPVSTSALTPAAYGQQRSTPMDDGVPTAAGPTKEGLGGCSHGL